MKKLNKKNLWPLILVGVLGNGLPYILFPIAVTKIDSSVVGVINSLVPLFTLLVGLVIYRFPIRRLQLIGIIIGFLGAFILINPTSAEIGPYWYFTFFAMAASLCYALSINIISNQLGEIDSLSITLLSLLFVGIPSTIYLIYADSLSVLYFDPVALKNFGYIAILGIVGTSLAVILFNYLIKLTSPAFSSSVTYFIPIIAILWGWADGESIGWHTLIGVAGILLGVFMVNRKRIKTQSN